MKKSLQEFIATFSDLDKIVSNALLYLGAIGGFIFGWMALSIILVSIDIGIPPILEMLLRVFYFLLAFVLGLKLVLYGLKLVEKYKN